MMMMIMIFLLRIDGMYLHRNRIDQFTGKYRNNVLDLVFQMNHRLSGWYKLFEGRKIISHLEKLILKRCSSDYQRKMFTECSFKYAMNLVERNRSNFLQRVGNCISTDSHNQINCIKLAMVFGLVIASFSYHLILLFVSVVGMVP